MLSFLVDVRDYIYIQSNYRANGLLYWVLTGGAVFFFYMGFFMLFGIIMPDALFLYLAGNKYYSPGLRYFNYLIIMLLSGVLAKGFNNITSKVPLPDKVDITPKVFRRKLLNTYLFLFVGFVFMISCIFIFGYVKFKR